MVNKDSSTSVAVGHLPRPARRVTDPELNVIQRSEGDAAYLNVVSLLYSHRLVCIRLCGIDVSRFPID